jgi:hypothetical protein
MEGVACKTCSLGPPDFDILQFLKIIHDQMDHLPTGIHGFVTIAIFDWLLLPLPPDP